MVNMIVYFRPHQMTVQCTACFACEGVPRLIPIIVETDSDVNGKDDLWGRGIPVNDIFSL